MPKFLIFAVALAFLSPSAQTRVYSVPALTEAYAEIYSNPNKAIKLTQRFIDQRTLGKTNTDKSELSLKTPYNTVQALHIQAQAYFNLDQYSTALTLLDFAEQTAIANDLRLSRINSLLHKAKVHWFGLQNQQAAFDALNQLDAALAVNQDHAMVNALRQIHFASLLLKGQIYSEQFEEAQAEQYLTQAQSFLEHLDNPQDKIDYYLVSGEHYLRYKHDGLSLDQLLAGYWLASEQDNPVRLAKANLLLAKLYERRKIFDKAIQHASAAGDYYDIHKMRKPLTETLTLIASIYEQQKRYNLALVHYFNALDMEKPLSAQSRSSVLRLNIARVYWQLFNFTHSEQYLDEAERIAEFNGDDNTRAQIDVMYAELMLSQSNTEQAINHLIAARTLATKVGNLALQIQTEKMLSRAYEGIGQYEDSLQAQRRHDQLVVESRGNRNKNTQEVFKGRQRMIERNIKLEELENQQREQQLLLFRNERALIVLSAIIVLTLLYARNRNKKYSQLNEHVTALQEDLYRHPRSGLRNLRLLNARLSSSMRQTSESFEQWHLAELINEPLSDRLRFALIHVPALREVYRANGYQHGLDLEGAFGEYLNQEVCDPARVYHFSDGIFLYLEPNARASSDPQQLADSLNTLIANFLHTHQLNETISLGLAEYPFLPRAYTAINDRELIDILLMALGGAISATEQSQHFEWVHMRAIEAAPAASFVNQPIREACIAGLQNGLIRVTTSSEHEITW